MPRDSATAIEDLPFFRFLPVEVRTQLARDFTRIEYPFGATIVREGDAADALYVLVSGRARVIKLGDSGEEITLNALRPGDVFGEMALLEQGPRTATVRASSEVSVLRLDRSIIDGLVRAHPEIRRHFELQAHQHALRDFFRIFTPFAELPAAALQLLLAGLETIPVVAGEVVVKEGDPPGPMFFVEQGRLRVFRGDVDGGRRQYLAYLRRGDFFGEVSLLKGAPRAATVEAASAATLLRLGRETFDRLVADHPAFRARIDERVAQYDFRRVAHVPLDFSEEILPAAANVVSDHDAVTTPVDAATNGRAPMERDAPARDGSLGRRGRRVRALPFVRQVDEMDCGAACLAMVCRHYGRRVSTSRLRALAHTSLDGTSLRGLCGAAEAVGLSARAVKASARDLATMPLPAIVHWDKYHWVVLYDVSDGHVRVVDPAIGNRRFSRAEFERRWSGYAALFDYTEAFAATAEEPARVGWLGQFFRPWASLFAKVIALAGIASALQMVLPVFTQVIVDRVVVERDIGLLNILVGAMLAAVVFMGLAGALQQYLLSFAAVRIDTATLDFLTRRMLALPMSYFSTRRTGDIQRRLGGMRQLREFCMQSGVVVLTSTVQLVASLALMLVYSPLLTGVFLLTVPVYLVLMRFSLRVLRPLFADMEEAYGKYGSHQIDAIKGIETVKALGAEGAFREVMLAQFSAVARKRFRADFTMLAYDGFLQLTTVLSVVLFLWVGARQVIAGSISIGALVAFNTLVAMANAPLVSLLRVWDSMQMMAVLLDRLNDIFVQDPEQGRDHSRLIPVRTLEGRVSVRGLGFRYGGPEAPAILEDISFDVAPNTTVAIVGRSGSGKTTLVKCLAGLLEPTAGTILYDGVDLRTVSYRDLRRQIGIVLQENHLFSETIARNIAFGEPEPDLDAVIWAARAANAHGFIERLPLGYETPIGEAGLAISGGQRQRIALARAFYHRPPLLVFDEATSSLDAESERAVKENMDRLLEGRTAFIVAHRLSTVRDADSILVFEKGRIVQRGTHDELMDRKGLYFYLCSQQLEP